MISQKPTKHYAIRKMYIITGSILLPLANLFVKSTAAGSFAYVSALYYTNDLGGACTKIQTDGLLNGHLTTGGAGSQMSVLTSNGTDLVNIYSTSNCSFSRAVHFHP